MTQTTASTRVFLADDSAMIRRRVAEMLAAQGSAVVGQAGTPLESIHGILASRPDVAVLDIQLDGGTGLQVLQAVRKAAPGVAFVVFSNSSGPAWRKRYMAAGAANFLDKSTEFDQLAAAVASAAQPQAGAAPCVTTGA